MNTYYVEVTYTLGTSLHCDQVNVKAETATHARMISISSVYCLFSDVSDITAEVIA